MATPCNHPDPAYRWSNLGDLIDRRAPLDRPAVIDLRRPEAPQAFSHAEIDRLANGVAALLRRRGLQRGDAVAIASCNRAEYLAAYFGIMRAGLVAVPLNIRQPAQTVDYVLADAGVVLAFVDAPRRAAIAARVPVIDFDEAGPDGFAAQAAPAVFESVPADSGDVAQMLYTSGSTGRPKGVPLTHAGQLWALAATTPHQAPGEQERYLLAQPLFHMNGLFMAKRAFATNSLLVVLPSFEASSYAEALAHYRITTVTAVPTMFARLTKDPAILAGRNYSALRQIMLGSAPMTQGLFERIQAAFPGADIAHGYGSTEAGPAIFGPHPGGTPKPPLALGYPLSHDYVRLAGDPGAREGVLWLRTPALFAGYHKLPAKNAEVLRDGWYDSGDVMRRDDHGFFYFVGRADDMFVCGGENIYPVEVEKLLESHPEVRQACVLALPDEERGQIPIAFVVRQPGSALGQVDLVRHALERGPAYQHPRRIRFLAELPWAGTHKIDRAALLALARELEATGAWLAPRNRSTHRE